MNATLEQWLQNQLTEAEHHRQESKTHDHDLDSISYWLGARNAYHNVLAQLPSFRDDEAVALSQDLRPETIFGR